MPADDPVPGPPEPGCAPGPTPLEQIVALLTHVISGWGFTLRLAVLVSVPIASVTAGIYACVRLAAHPGEWWMPVALGAACYVGVRALQLIRRRIRKSGHNRR